MNPAQWYRKRTIQQKIFLSFFVITWLSTALFTIYGFFQNSLAIMNEIDKRLLTATLTVPQLLPTDYFERILTPNSISPEEHKLHTQRLNSFLHNVGGTYLYVLHLVDGKYYFVASADPETGYWVEYKQPAPNIYEIQKTWEPDISTTLDPEYGLLRSVVISYKDASGRRFIIGADIDAHEVELLKKRAFTNFLLMGSASFLLALLFSYAASLSISKPLKQLSCYTRRLVEGNFSSTIRLDAALFPDGNQTQAETAILAYDFDQMQKNLEMHIRQLQFTQSARDRAESELRIAGQIQATFLPGPFAPSVFNPWLQLCAMMKTAKQAGGDLYDYFALDDHHLFFVIGDVAGKGMPAALFMSVTVALLRSAVKVQKDPAAILQRVNDDLSYRNESCTFVTLFLGILEVETGEIIFANGGHNPPRLRTADGRVRELAVRRNFVIGAMEEMNFVSETLTLQPGETLFLYTDGVTEAMNLADQLYGEERMDSLISGLPAQVTVSELIQVLAVDIAEFSGDCEQSDDITMLAIQRRGA